MRTAFAVIGLVLFVFYLLILARVVVDTTRSFARSWRPTGTAAVGFELVYLSTDPPVKALRRLIPPLRIGPIAVDLSVWLLLLTVFLLRAQAVRLAHG
ncbi:MAG: YggT family protein [bacterium]